MDLSNRVRFLLDLYVNLVCHQSTAVFESIDRNEGSSLDSDILAEYELKIRESFDERCLSRELSYNFFKKFVQMTIL